MLHLLETMTLGQQDMRILGFLFPSTRHIARLSVKLCMGVWLLSGAAAMAQTPDGRVAAPVLLAQNLSFLEEGAQGAAVVELQRQLNSNGLFSGAIDGIYDGDTTQAVRQYQRIRRLDVTGIADENTLDLLGVDLGLFTSGLSHPIHGFIGSDRISPSSSLEDVETLQRVLNMFGFDLDPDGIYGAQTEQAVRTYERTAGLPVDGVADLTTLLDMGFSDSGSGSRAPGDIGSSRSVYGNYVAAIIATHSELNTVRQDFPEATAERNNLGEYISIGRFVNSSDADDWADFASRLGYEARVLRD